MLWLVANLEILPELAFSQAWLAKRLVHGLQPTSFSRAPPKGLQAQLWPPLLLQATLELWVCLSLSSERGFEWVLPLSWPWWWEL